MRLDLTNPAVVRVGRRDTATVLHPGTSKERFVVTNPGGSRWGADWRVPLGDEVDEAWLIGDVYHPARWDRSSAPGDRKSFGLAGYTSEPGRIGDTDGSGRDERHRADQFAARHMLQARRGYVGAVGYLNAWAYRGVLHDDHRASGGGISSFHEGLRFQQDRRDCRFPPGQWVTVEQRVVLNTPGRCDGVVEWWVNGKRAAGSSQVGWRLRDDLRINAVTLAHFWGGPIPAEAPNRPVTVRFRDLEWDTVRIGS